MVLILRVIWFNYYVTWKKVSLIIKLNKDVSASFLLSYGTYLNYEILPKGYNTYVYIKETKVFGGRNTPGSQQSIFLHTPVDIEAVTVQIGIFRPIFVCVLYMPLWELFFFAYISLIVPIAYFINTRDLNLPDINLGMLTAYTAALNEVCNYLNLIQYKY